MKDYSSDCEVKKPKTYQSFGLSFKLLSVNEAQRDINSLIVFKGGIYFKSITLILEGVLKGDCASLRGN